MKEGKVQIAKEEADRVLSIFAMEAILRFERKVLASISACPQGTRDTQGEPPEHTG